MQFLRSQSLKNLALLILGALVIVFTIEFFVIRYKVSALEEIEEKKDFTRSIQLRGQELAYMIQLGLQRSESVNDEVYARTAEIDHLLNILGKGGRIDRSEVFLNTLSRLPQITYDNLSIHWSTYKENITRSLLSQPEEPQPVATPDSVSIAGDSTTLAVPVVQSQLNSRALLPGQWLTVSQWFEKLLIDLSEEAVVKKVSVERWVLGFIVFDVVLLASLFLLLYRFILQPLKKIRENTANRNQDFSFADNELGALTREVNVILEQLKDAAEFVGAIGEGKLDYDYRQLDAEYEPGRNKLADSLILMQGKLKSLNEEEQRRQWATEGLTKFVDILRSSNDNISALGDRIISTLVKYTNANQGGLYVLNDEDEDRKHLELVSLFAFDNKKYEAQTIKPGEGILGQTFLEKETTLLNEIPEEYIRITSGLGGANPRSLLVVPLKVDKDVYGIVELASFRNFQAHEITFVEKLAETIASTLASVKVAQKNRMLIQQFQETTEEMRAQEEEMRQNMEELQATQEELSRKEQDYIQRIKDLETTVKGTVAREELDKARADFNQKLMLAEQRVLELQQKLAQKGEKSDDWQLAEEVSRTLQMQIESLRITEEALRGGGGVKG